MDNFDTEVMFDNIPLSGWYPGHMRKANRQMKDAMKLIDIIVEVCDARAPLATRNPHFDKIFNTKPRIIMFNKADLADVEDTQKWIEWYAKKGIEVEPFVATKIRDIKWLANKWKEVYNKIREERGATQQMRRPIRVLISGVPNVGKSTLINRLSVERRAEVGAKPGVTKIVQWIPIEGGIELLDSPGVLWPKIKKKSQELRLAICGCVKDEAVGIELLADFLFCEYTRLGKLDIIEKAYNFKIEEDNHQDFLKVFARKRGMLRGGGKEDLDRASLTFVKDFREGKLGRITFELPPADDQEIEELEGEII